MPPESWSIFACRLVLELDEFEQLANGRQAVFLPDIEVPRIHDEVLGHGKIGVEVLFLGHDAETGFDVARPGSNVHAEDRHRARCRRHVTGDDAHDRGLPCPVRAEEAEALSLLNGEVDAVDGPEAVVVFDEIVRGNDVHGR